MKNIFYWLFGLLAVVAVSCSSKDSLESEPVPEPEPEAPSKIPINLLLGITKVTENAFDANDKVGVYVVNYNDSIPGTLSNGNNHVSNAQFTYNGSRWTAGSNLYWKDETTHADFYVYHPYSATVNSVNAHKIILYADQSIEQNYKGCDVLWGKASNISPTSEAVNIQTKHIMSAAVITLAPGAGFAQNDLGSDSVRVKINHVKTEANIDLATGTISVAGTAQSITPLYKSGKYHAFIVPQTISAANFITVTVNGVDYNLNKEFTFKAGERHSFTVKLNKLSDGINIGITGWDEDEEDNGGTAY